MDYVKVAHLYDSYVNTAFDVPFFLSEAQRVHGSVLELMAGTGRVSVPLAEAGVELTCVDVSPDMLDILRRKLAQRGLQVALHRADVTCLTLGRRFDLILLPFHSFGEIPDGAGQFAALKAIGAHLSDRGRFLCTLHNPEHRVKHEDGRLRLLADVPMDDGQRLLLWGTGTYDAPAATVSGKQFYEVFDRGGVMTSRMMLDVRFSVLRRSQFEELARRAGLEVQTVYGDYDRAPFDEDSSPFMIFALGRGESRRQGDAG